VVYLECAKGAYGVWGQSPPEAKLKPFVNECVTFDDLEEKISKGQKCHHKILRSAWGQVQAP